MTVHHRPPLLRADAEGVATLTLNRPEARNALCERLIAALSEALAAIAADDSVRVVVLAANGAAFCSGHDLREMQRHRTQVDRGRAYYGAVMGRCATLMKAIARSPKPVVAAVEGVAAAAGCQLVASCDLAIAGEKARFSTPGVDIGLFCTTPMVALTRAIAPKHAFEMLLTGEAVDAAEAHRIGLVNRVAPAGQALAEAEALARRIATKSPLSLRIGKEAFHTQRTMDLDSAYSYGEEVMVENMLTADAAEGIAAFLEKRRPVWRGT